MQVSQITAATLLLLSAVARSEDSCDTALGERVFAKCSACHSLQQGQHLMRPSLANIVGSQAGRADGFYYSAAMADAAFVWSRQNLSDFLRDPMRFLPGTSMPFAGIKHDGQRRALICYRLKGS